jgi:hypothetical protein
VKVGGGMNFQAAVRTLAYDDFRTVDMVIEASGFAILYDCSPIKQAKT